MLYNVMHGMLVILHGPHLMQCRMDSHIFEVSGVMWQNVLPPRNSGVCDVY